MQIATHLLTIAEQRTVSDQAAREAAWRRYWRGDGDMVLRVGDGDDHRTIAIDTIWEYLIDGIVELEAASGQ